MKNILITGGLGFIGSHTTVELYEQGYTPVVLDNLQNSEPWIRERIEKIIDSKVKYYEIDCSDENGLDSVFEENIIDGVIHFAADKAVGESVAKPLKYYENNLGGLVSVLKVARKHNCLNFVFSSSCTVYGTPNNLPVDENAEIKASNSPYGTTKIFGEKIIDDFVSAEESFKAVLLRYFNPIGAHSSSLIGELPKGIPSNLVPFITQTAAGLRDSLTVFGDDYDTTDGSCIRDFIHVTDLAKAHIKALEYINSQSASVCEKVNIGTGKGVSVLELINEFEKSTGEKLNYSIGPRREGDVEAVYANAAKSKKILNWEAEISTKQALLDAWNWQKTLNS